MSKTYISLILIILFSFFFNNIALSWDDKVTHKDLSEFAGEICVLDKNKGDYLKNIGFVEGLKEKCKWGETERTVKDWLRDGAMLEDSSGPLSVGYIDGKGRSFNHFHNALKQAPWLDAGLNDTITLPSRLPPFYVTVSLTGKSSLLWAQDGAYQENFYEGNWSWNKTREYYYTAITGRDLSGNVVAADETKKKEFFAKAFSGLGHQMHLLQDTAVPDHVRNDAHPEDALFGKNTLNGSRYFETWTKEIIRDLTEMKSFAKTPIFPNVPMNISRQGFAPITQLYDSDQYDGLNASAGTNQGLAEYTNANFFSGDTIFAAERYSTDHRHYFPFPRRASTDLARFIAGTKPVETIVDEEGNTVTGIWISKVSDGENVSHLAKTSDLTRLAYNVLGEGEVFYSTFYKDEKCHEDYAALLLPRAVGYSAGLLNYFFRGQMEISLPASAVYAKIDDPAKANEGFKKVTLLAKNITPNSEQMTNGDISLVVKYKLAQSDPFHSVPAPVSADFSYIVVPEANGARSIPSNTAVELTFNLGQSALPLYATDVYLQLVYHGKLGNEDGAVAVGFKDISEPTPIDEFNNMDRICINGQWYVTGTDGAYGALPSDKKWWDYWPHDLKDEYIKISPVNNPSDASPTNYTFSKSLIEAGAFYRVYILSDYAFVLSDYGTEEKKDPHDLAAHSGIKRVTAQGSGVRNQEGQTSLFYPFRGVEMWGPGGIITDGMTYPNYTDPGYIPCSWGDLAL